MKALALVCTLLLAASAVDAKPVRHPRGPAPAKHHAAAEPERHTGWICQVANIPTRYELKGRKLLGFEDATTGRPNPYAVTADTPKLLTAVRALPHGRTVTVSIDKTSRRFRQVMAVRHSDERQSHTGYCARWSRKG